MNKKLLTLVLLIFTLLVACNANNTDESEAMHNDSMAIKDLVEAYSGNKTTDETASITSTQLIVNDKDDKALAYDLPEEEFFVSIAPFLNETHPCDIHSLTGCQGELTDQDFDIYIEDTEEQVVLDETINSESNGFIDLWLPRDQTFNVNISHDGKQVKAEISTFETDGTCITTMQLS